MIAKHPKRDLELFLRDWNRRDFKFFWEEEPGIRFNYWNKKRVMALYDIAVKIQATMIVKLHDFYLAITESDSSYEKCVCDVASNKQIETSAFYSRNKKNIIDFTKRYNKNEVSLCCRKNDSDFACQDEWKLNPDELPLLYHLSMVNLYVEEI